MYSAFGELGRPSTTGFTRPISGSKRNGTRTTLHAACRRHGPQFHYEKHGKRNSVERVFREVKRRTSSFSNCFSHAETESADEWLRAFAFAWNQLIRTLHRSRD
jgi:transposase-like protein